MQIIVTDELYHHGILGMHWGIRRYQNKDGSLTAEGIKRYRTDLKFKTKYDKQTAKRDADRAERIKTKSIKELSDDELRERIQRLELEKKVVDLERAINGGGQNNQNQNNSQNKAVQETVSFGKKFAKGVLDGTTKLATAYVSKKIFNAIFDKIGDSSSGTKNEIRKAMNEASKDLADSLNVSDNKNKDAKNKGAKNKGAKNKGTKNENDTKVERTMTYNDYVNGWDYDKNESKIPYDPNPFKSSLSGSDKYKGDKYDWLADVGSKKGTKLSNLYNMNTDKGYTDMFYGSSVHDRSTIKGYVEVDSLLKNFGDRKV